MCFVLGSMTIVASAQYQQSLEQQVHELQQHMQAREDAEWLFESRMIGWTKGNYVLVVHSNQQYQIVFSGEKLPTTPMDLTYSGVNPETAIFNLWVDGKLIYTINLSGIVQPGDFVDVWADKNPSTDRWMFTCWKNLFAR